MSEIISARARLRRFQMSDLPLMLELETDPDIMRYTPTRFPLAAEQIEKRLRSFIDKEASFAPLGIWAAEEKDNGTFIGWFMLLPTAQEYPELGFMLVKRQWGKGLATEIAQALLSYGMYDLGLPGISATTDVDNFSSMRILQKLGFQFSKSILAPNQALQRDIGLKVFVLKK